MASKDNDQLALEDLQSVVGDLKGLFLDVVRYWKDEIQNARQEGRPIRGVRELMTFLRDQRVGLPTMITLTRIQQLERIEQAALPGMLESPVRTQPVSPEASQQVTPPEPSKTPKKPNPNNPRLGKALSEMTSEQERLWNAKHAQYPTEQDGPGRKFHFEVFDGYAEAERIAGDMLERSYLSDKLKAAWNDWLWQAARHFGIIKDEDPKVDADAAWYAKQKAEADKDDELEVY